jgi:hypothetical protein
VFNIVRYFLTTLLPSSGKADVRAAKAATAVGMATAIDAAATAADTAAIATAGVIAVDISAITVDASALATDAAATAADATASGADAAAAAPAPVRSAKPQGRKVMSSGFDMQAEIARLARRIIEPAAARLTAQELEQVVSLTRDVFEQFNTGRPAPEAGFADVAVSIIEPVQASLTDIQRRRVVDRLSGAMAAFCQGVGQRAA